jgi:hypothetical protein
VPSVQRGQVYKKPSGTWAYRYRDENGTRREVAQFTTRREAAEALDETLTRLRRGARYRPDTTLAELVDLYLAQHQADPGTIAKLRQELKPPVRAFGGIRVANLLPAEIARWRATLSEGYSAVTAEEDDLQRGDHSATPKSSKRMHAPSMVRGKMSLRPIATSPHIGPHLYGYGHATPREAGVKCHDFGGSRPDTR